MKRYVNFHASLEWLFTTFQFIKNNFWTILTLGLLAAVGRAIQLKVFGSISPLTHTLLEILIESSRLIIIFYVLGFTDIRLGLKNVMQFFANKTFRRKNWLNMISNFRQRWKAILINLVAFSGVAFILNMIIDHIAYETCLYVVLTTRQLISDQGSEWILILFLKNISVIPFTLVFQTLFLLWMTNSLPPHKKNNKKSLNGYPRA